MRPLNYINNMADRFGVPVKTVTVIDRELGENGLRRKGRGRSMPAPSLNEDLYIVLAVNLIPDWPVAGISQHVARWAALPRVAANGDARGDTFLQGLRWLCAEIREGFAKSDRVMVELDKTNERAVIDFGDGRSLMFAGKGEGKPLHACTLRRIRGLEFAGLAFAPRPAE